MDATQLERFRRRLLELRSELQAQDQATQEDSRPIELDQARVGRLSRMDAMQAQEMAQETARRRQRQLAEVDGALRRIESGDYGHCYSCGEEIDIRRLDVDPAITRCIKCAEG